MTPAHRRHLMQGTRGKATPCPLYYYIPHPNPFPRSQQPQKPPIPPSNKHQSEKKMYLCKKIHFYRDYTSS